MKLNDYKSEVKEFLKKVNVSGDSQEQKLIWLEQEFALLKMAVKNAERGDISHQIYDMMYLLFELAVDNDCDLDYEWEKGKKKKVDKYLKYHGKSVDIIDKKIN